MPWSSGRAAAGAPTQPDLSTAVLPAPDYLDLMLACGVPQESSTDPNSIWLEAEKAAFADVVEKTKSEVLIVPVQIQGYGLDRIERALMTLDLANEVGTSTTVVDPQLTARALGEGARRYDPAAIAALAQRVGAKKIIVAFAGHDRHHRMTLTVQVYAPATTPQGVRLAKIAQQDWRMIPFSDAHPPFVVFHEMLPKIMTMFGPQNAFPQATRPHPRKPYDFIQAPAGLAAANAAGAPTSAGLILLGALASPAALGPFASPVPELPRERLFERAFIAAQRFDAADTNGRFLQAYALMNLDHRPAALELIAGFAAPEALVMRARLNGDLPAAEAALKSVADPLQTLLLEIAVQDLRQAYGGPNPGRDLGKILSNLFGARHEDWRDLVQARLHDGTIGPAESPLEIKLGLDRVLPVAGLDPASVIQGNSLGLAPSQNGEVSMDVLIARHIRSVVASLPGRRCCGPSSERLTSWDFLSLFESRAGARIADSLNVVRHTGDSWKATMQRVQEYEPYFSGYPVLIESRATAALALANQGPDESRPVWRREAEVHGRSAAFASPGENKISYLALLVPLSEPIRSILGDVYGFDYPRRSYWSPTFVSQTGVFDAATYADLVAESLAYSQYDYDATAASLTSSDIDVRNRTYDELAYRFKGAPGRDADLAARPVAADKQPDEIEVARATIAAAPGEWTNYFVLGERLVSERGDYEGASHAFLSYPPFTSKKSQSPFLSQQAYQAGTLLWLHGHPDLAIPFYKIARGNGPDSDAALESDNRMKLLEGNYTGVLAGLRARVKAFPSAYAFRDYFSLQHALGEEKQAWLGFSQTAAAFELPQVWVSALVGHQLAGRSDAYVREWLTEPNRRGARFRSQQFAPWFYVLWVTADRTPPADFAEFVKALESGPGARVTADGLSLERPDPDHLGDYTRINPSWLRGKDAPKLAPLTPVKSDLVFFAAGFADLRHHLWQKALQDFNSMADWYPLDGIDYGYALSYFAMASTKVAGHTELEGYLEQMKGSKNFDVRLARAIFAAAHGDNETALRLLHAAFNVRPSTDFRPILTEYQFADACEWLFQETGDHRFIEMLLEWTEQYERIQPTHAWADAMDYTYSPPGSARRIRALAMTLRLNPSSERIKNASQEELRVARSWLHANDPFAVPTMSTVSNLR